jgi:hypothetical protein
MKPAFNQFDPAHFRQRWVCYLDVLGFKKLVGRNAIETSVNTYFRSREIVERWLRKGNSIELACFSDTFILYSRDDSAGHFSRIEQAARWILNENLQARIPIRGALSCGEFYSDSENNIFIGRALLEAYGFGEKQNWIGFILCRSATRRLTTLRLPAPERLNYRRWKIPFNNSKVPGATPLYGYLIGATCPMNGRNIYRDIIQEMGNTVHDRQVKKKYENTLRFLDHFGIAQPVKPIEQVLRPVRSKRKPRKAA